MADIRTMFGAKPSRKSPSKQKDVVALDEDKGDSDFEETSKSKSPTKSAKRSPTRKAAQSPAYSEEEEDSSSRKRKKARVIDENSEAGSPVKPSKNPIGKLPFTSEPKLRPAAPSAAKDEKQLWADKYAPQNFDDLVGAQSIVKSLTQWLKDWDDVHLHKTKKIPYDKSNPGAKAALLSGPPGIGKSTSARLVAEACGREVFELNASDTRSKKLLSEELGDVVQASVLSFSKPKRRIVVMDEVDGMSSSDRGGIAELIKIIKTTRTPIICICNDYSKSSVRSLANHCFDLKFQRPQLPSIVKRLKEVARKEQVIIDDEALETIAKSSGNDIRQVLNALQMWSVSAKRVTGTEAKSRLGEINKDAVLRLSSFDATRFMFCESHISPLNTRNEAFFSDYDMIPLMIAQNYINATMNSRTCSGDVAKMARLSRAADAVCDADLVAKYVRSDQRWDLLTTQAMLNIRVAYICDGGIGFPGFPEWLGKNSNAMKRARLLSELTSHVRASKSATSTDKVSLRLDYIPAMRNVMVLPLAKQGVEAVDDVITYLDEYSMSRDDLFESLRELQFPESPEFKDYYALIQPTTKAAFTRDYNKRAHRSQVLGQEEGISKKGKRRAAADIDDEDGEDIERDAEAEEDDIDIEAFRAKSKKRAAPSASSTASSSKKKKTK